MSKHYICELSEKVARGHVSYKNRYGLTLAADLLYDRTDRIPFGKLESFFRENLK